MLKHFNTLQVALAGLVALPGLAGQKEGPQGLVDQLDATITSLDYLSEIVRRLEGGNEDAVQMLLGATEPARQSELQSEARLVALRSDVSRLRLALDRMMESAGSLVAVPGSSADSSRGATAHVPRSPDQWTPGSLVPTLGMDAQQTGTLKSVLPPLQHVDPSSQRRGTDLVALEDRDFSADAVRQGKLLFRAQRYPESIQLLRPLKEDVEARYWLAQGYRAMGRVPEALDILRDLTLRSDAGAFARYAQSDLDFIDFERQLAARKTGGGQK